MQILPWYTWLQGSLSLLQEGQERFLLLKEAKHRELRVDNAQRAGGFLSNEEKNIEKKAPKRLGIVL